MPLACMKKPHAPVPISEKASYAPEVQTGLQVLRMVVCAMLDCASYALLDDGMGFRLVPWSPVIEQRLCQQLAATVRGGGVSRKIGR